MARVPKLLNRAWVFFYMNHPLSETTIDRQHGTRKTWVCYAFSIAITGIVIGLHFLISPYINRDAFLFLLAIFLSAILTSLLIARLKEANSTLKNALVDLEKRLTHEIAQRNEAEKTILEVSNREQRRLGQDVHDGLSQILVGVKFITEELKEDLKTHGLPQAKSAALIESRLSEALAQSDLISRGLTPVELESNGLMPALEELATKVSKIHPVRCRIKCFFPVDIHDSTITTHIYRIAQEAVMNAIKGGKAKNITIQLRRRQSMILLSVTDDGIGFHKKPLRQGMGLKIMEYRTRMINGSLHFQSRSRGGTRVTCSFSI
jgi:signal transduction histidine kinase